ncbi:MAG TPA: precorrin-3B C(17)-methyltransferase [Parvibaculum sp.]|jgi:precorrin-3B C17-methyltransferase
MSGRLRVIGLGPGPADWLTPEAAAALTEVSDVLGYASYLDRVAIRPGQTRHASDNREELDRARHALTLASKGRDVAIVSGGDPGVFAMAAAVFEAIEEGPSEWRALDVAVLPGVTAVLAAAARVGAPLGADFCAINLSINLKPWPLIEKRLALAAEADFVIALYNPASKARSRQIHEAFDILRAYRATATPVVLARAVGRPDENIAVATLADADLDTIDMSTLVIIGSSATRILEHGDNRKWVYSPRRVEASS